MRTLTYAQAIREAHAQMLALDPRVFVIGQGLWSPWYAGRAWKDSTANLAARGWWTVPCRKMR